MKQVKEWLGKKNTPPVNEHFKLQIKTLLQNAPRRDADDKLEWLLEVKQGLEDGYTHGYCDGLEDEWSIVLMLGSMEQGGN